VKELLAAGRAPLREARLAARLAHPHVAAVHDVVVTTGTVWVVQQLVRARSLAALIEDRGPLSVPAAIRLGRQVLAALRAVHAAGVLHLDVKPGNILVTPRGRAVLTDFGVSTTLAEAGDPPSGAVRGTPAYVAPERILGEPSTEKTDLWSLGATLYCAVEGRGPFGAGTGAATLWAAVNRPPDPFRLAGALAPVISGLLAKDPADRPDAVEALARLDRLAALCGAASGMEDAHPAGPDEEPQDDQDDPPQQLTAGQDHVDPGDDENDGDDPQQSTHETPTALGVTRLTEAAV
ncbi:MAG: serine/threonine protein kinase, partial [Nonomuraea sp.]|nr:serine/threonine protein kinase [Nonomuraea sp.]